jgi:Glycosyltransferase family 87
VSVSHLERKSSDSKLLDLSDSAVRERLRPIIITITFLMFFVSVAGVFLTLPLGKSGRVDFRHLYTAGYMVRVGHARDVYDYALYEEFQKELVGPAQGALPFNHLAYEALFYVPFALLTYQHAYLAFWAANLIILAGSIRILRPLFSPLAQVWSQLPVAIVVCFLPVSIALIEGQDSLILLGLFAAAISAEYAQKDFTAGVLLGLSLFKFQYALPVVLLFFVWKRWRFVAGFAISGGLVVGISIWITGLSGSITYARSILAMSAKYSSANGLLYGIHPDGMPNLRGLAYMITGGSVSTTHWIVAVGSAVVMVWGALKRPSFPGALLPALLVSYHQVIADTSLLILPIGLVLVRGLNGARTRRDDFTTVLAYLAFVSPTVLLFANTRFYLLALPAGALFVLWDGQEKPSPKNLYA